MKRLTAIASGRVQGVGYRASVIRGVSMIAGVTGYVKNLPDGRLEIIAEGTETSLAEVIEVAKAGSGWSDVSDLDVNYSDAKGVFLDFTVSY
ncbi:MAG: acylphosphatase [Denitrovibrio sp.]|nr:MAG: acylphosphatase [Denitrovibrio sp.]